MSAVSAITGRIREQKTLESIWTSNEAELVAVYGRRRVGKTHLVREYFSGKGLYCEVVGKYKGKKNDQLKSFISGFSKTFYPGLTLEAPENWMKAFELLTTELERLPKTKKVVVFLDELPWLATIRSDCISALDYYWNTYWVRMPNVKIIVCGSAAAWMLRNVINAKGGLHNRLTRVMLIEPFNLYDTKKIPTP